MKKKLRRAAAALIASVMLLLVFPLQATAGDTVYYPVEGVNYELKTGTFALDTAFGDCGSQDNPYFYSDGYFAGDPTVFDSHLATMSFVLAEAALTTHSDQCTALLGELGFSDITTNAVFHSSVNDDGKTDNTTTSIGYALARKTMRNAAGASTGKTIVAVTIRSGGYEKEWVSNFVLGSSGDAAGFGSARDEVVAGVKDYIGKSGLTNAANSGNVIFWVVGYSRGAAVANLTAKELIDSYVTAKSNKLFCYTAGTPKGGAGISADDHTYDAIHSTVNDNDIVTMMAPSQYGLGRYGQDNNITSIATTADTESRWYQQWRLSVPEDSEYTNQFHTAHLDSGLDLPDPTETLYNLRFTGDTNLTAALALVIWDYYKENQEEALTFDDFIVPYTDGAQQISMSAYLQDLTANLTATNWLGDRSAYAAYKFNPDGTGSNLTEEQTIGVVIELSESLTNAQMEALTDCFKGAEKALGLDTSSLSGIKNTLDTLLPHYRNAMAWNDSSYTTVEEKNATISWAWNIVKSCKNESGQTIADILTAEQYQKVEKGFPTLVDVILKMFNEDYYKRYTSSTAAIANSGERMYVLCTLAYNLVKDDGSFVAAHYPEVYFAALRTTDDFYVPYRIAVNGVLQPVSEGNAQTVWFAAYAANGKQTGQKTVDVTALPYGTILNFTCKANETWAVYQLDTSCMAAQQALRGAGS